MNQIGSKLEITYGNKRKAIACIISIGIYLQNKLKYFIGFRKEEYQQRQHILKIQINLHEIEKPNHETHHPFC